MEPRQTDLQHPAGLCGSCRHVRVVPARGDSRYYRCERSAGDPRYPRYPVLPVLQCPGHEPRGPEPAPATTRR